jgi:hypothetical protein
MGIDISQHINTIIISMGIIIGFVLAVLVLIRAIVIEDSQGEILNTRFLLTVIGTIILAMFGMGVVVLMVLGITLNEGYMTAFAGISGAFITIVGTSYNSYFKDRASEKSVYSYHANPETSAGTGNSQEPSISSFDQTRKMPLLQTR